MSVDDWIIRGIAVALLALAVALLLPMPGG